jgi:hypothetical protein
MTTFHRQSVKRSRKRRQCTWCAESIEIGQPYESYRWSDAGDAVTVRMHPECLAAMDRVAKEAGGDFCWSPGDFERGESSERI